MIERIWSSFLIGFEASAIGVALLVGRGNPYGVRIPLVEDRVLSFGEKEIMKTIDLSKYIQEVGEWSKRNFPGKVPLEPAMGVVEEVGELAHAILKRRQGIRGTVAEHDAAEQDAIADAAVFLCDLASQLGIHTVGCEPHDMRELGHAPIGWFSQLNTDAANLLICVINADDDPDFIEAIACVLIALFQYAYSRGWDFLELLDRTWGEVKKRDWIKFPGSGLPPKESVA